MIDRIDCPYKVNVVGRDSPTHCEGVLEDVVKFFYTWTVAAVSSAGIGSPIYAEALECTGQTLETCPGACIERCLSDDSFFDENAAACGRVVRASQSDPASLDTSTCSVPGAAQGSEFGSCLTAARSIVRPDTGREELENLFSSAPTCAATPFSLNEQYSCLGSETDTIRDLFAPLVGRGYIIPADEEITPESPICKISNTQIDTDEFTAESLTSQSKILTTEFSTVSSCRREWEAWLNDAADDSVKSETGTIEAAIDAVISAMQRNIQPAEAREVEIQRIIDDIDVQLEQITGVILVRNLICPPVE